MAKIFQMQNYKNILKIFNILHKCIKTFSIFAVHFEPYSEIGFYN